MIYCGGGGGGSDGVGVRTNLTLQTFLSPPQFTIGADKVESKVTTLTSSITNV